MSNGKFEKGHVPKNSRPLGYERKDRRGNTIVKVKMSGSFKEMWERKQMLVWEQTYGYKPDDDIIIFADGNKQNFEIDNLMLVTRSELMELAGNKFMFKNKELTKFGINYIRLRNRRKTLEGEE